MPSRTEGFGLAALEALSAGLPVLVSGNSGLGDALKKVLHGSNCVVNSDDPKRWAKAIQAVCGKDRGVRLGETKDLCGKYAEKYSWEEQCGRLVQKMMDITFNPDSQFIPSYVLARGEAYKAAYLRALETGETTDKRVKVLLIGQDRVGKTSVGRSLKGETFNKNESSTDGVQIDKALKNVSKFPWKNPIEEKEITAFHHKCGLYISTDLSTTESAQQEEVDDKTHLGGFAAGDGDSASSGHESKENILVLEENFRITKKRQDPSATQQGKNEEIDSTTKHQKRQGKNESATRPIEVPENIKRVTENILKGEAENSDKIWPVIFDFAGQAIYRATHPIFVSSEAIYVLVLDLSKDLSDIAQCYVREPDCGEVRIPAPDSDDTNLDHIMRWLDLVHSFEHTENRTVLPPVILVGTHADLVKDNPCGKMAYLLDNLSNTVEAFSEHILEETFVVDNTRSGQEHDNEDPQIISLRNKILEVGECMPHTKKVVPLKWLQLEDMVEGRARKGENYITRQEFKTDIFDEICPSESADDFDALLLFLHDRGSVIYHDCTNDQDSLVVLNPRWLTNVLRQIITFEKQTKVKPRIQKLRRKLEGYGILDKELLDYSCESLGVTNIKEPLLFIMKKFNLLCQLDCQDGNSMYLVPCMLTSQRHDVMTSNIPANPALAPVYITFDTRYVPIGLFSRLIVLFVEFASRKVKCDQPRLCSNFAQFFIGNVTGVEFVCYRCVIQVRVFDHCNPSDNPVEKEPHVCSELFSFLKSGLKKLQEECHWLKAVSWDLSARCNLCPAKLDTGTAGCFWHQREDCSHFDCAHFVSLTKKPVRCALTGGPFFRPPKTWSQALEELSQPGTGANVEVDSSGKQSPRKGKKRKISGSTLDQVPNGSPSRYELEMLSRRIGNEWVPLAYRLKFHDGDVTGFKINNPVFADKIQDMLFTWKKRDGAGATYQVLCKALCHKLVRCGELAQLLASGQFAEVRGMDCSH